MNDSALDDKPDFEPELKKTRRNYHPWRRLFARLIDYQISGLIFTGLIFSTRLAPDFIVNPLQIQNSFQVASSWAMGFFSMALWVVLEPLILSKFNNTPGKALLRLKLVPNDEHSSYWKRSFSVWAVGLAFGIPLIETFASIIAAIRLKNRGLTDWDRWYGFRVVADEFGFKRGLVAFVLVALVFASNVVLMSDLAWLGPKNTTQVEQSIQSTKENVTPKWEELNSTPPAPSPKEELVKLQKEAEQGDADAQFQLGAKYQFGEGLPIDNVKAIEWNKKAAEQGNSNGQVNLGYMYSKGYGVAKNDVKAVEWYQKAAEQGNSGGQLNLGNMYANGSGIPKDDVKAFQWYQKAAEQGIAIAQYDLGEMYLYGRGIPKDDVKAFEWYQKAAIQGDLYAQINLGLLFWKGDGVTKDLVRAFEWWQKAANQGDIYTQFRLGNMYENGLGVSKDHVKATEWYIKAASQGSSNAQANLSVKYFFGEGVSKDIVLAYAWANLAAAQGDDTAQNNRDIYEKQLSNAERMEGQRLASNWKKGDNLLSSNTNVKQITPTNQAPTKQATGTAFTVSSEGHALTNHHVINGCAEVKVAGREGLVKVITSDSVNDLALLQLPRQIDNYAKLNPNTGKLRQGEDIIVFGYPLNFALSSGGNLTPGTLSALTGLGNNTNQIQITAPIQPGSSGSPVMDKKGDVVGVVSMKLDDGELTKLTGQIGQNVSFAVNGQTVKAFLDANNVPYKTGGGFFSTEKNNADIADEARKWTVLVECWK